ncbi:MAG: ABC transporter permease subunit [Thermoplasmatales archaeon]
MLSLPLIILILEATGVTLLRLWILMGASIFVAVIFGIISARVKVAELIVLPIVDVLEAVPVVSFFPIVLVFFIVDIGGPIGTELAVDVLIITALVWNIIIGVYQAVAHIPQEMIDTSLAFKMSLWKRIRNLYLPSSYQKIVANIMPSFASGLFYITFSEVISLGPHSYHVFGIGDVAFQLTEQGNIDGTLLLIAVLVVAIVLNFILIINPLVNWSRRYTFEFESSEQRQRKRTAIVNSLSQRTNGIINAVGKMFSSVSTVAARLPSARRVKKIRASTRAINIVIGSVLILILLVSIYLIAQSGFSKAFTVYFTRPSFLAAASIGTAYDLARIAIVYAVSVLTMVPLAIVAGRMGREGDTLNGTMQVLYSVPAPIFYPLILKYLTPFLMKGMSFDMALNVNVLIITYLSAASYIFFNVFTAVRGIPAEFDMVARTFKLGRLSRLRYVTIPAIIPAFVTGSMSAVGSYWAGLMIGEYQALPSGTYAVSFGLMKMIDQAIDQGNLLYADAIDIFMVIIIIVMSYLLWIRLFEYSRKRFSF